MAAYSFRRSFGAFSAENKGVFGERLPKNHQIYAVTAPFKEKSVPETRQICGYFQSGLPQLKKSVSGLFYSNDSALARSVLMLAASDPSVSSKRMTFSRRSTAASFSPSIPAAAC